MFMFQGSLRCCEAYLRSAAANVSKQAKHAAGLPNRCATGLRPRVLVVEFRDEIYAGLKTLFEEQDFEVERAEYGAHVAAAAHRFAPDLVLVNEDMPDETGWLITCKLRLAHHRQPVWLYAARRPQSQADWKEFTGVDEVIEYRGDFVRLVQHVRQQLAKWLGGPASQPPRCETAVPVASLVA